MKLFFALVGVAPLEIFLKSHTAGRAFPYSNQNPNFLVDVDAIPVGAIVTALVVLSVMAKGA